MESLYALDTNGAWACATSTEYRRGVHYYCDCPDRHKMKLVKASGDPEKRPFRAFFAHIASGHKHSRDGDIITCRQGGESLEHRTAKHRLREMVGRFSYVSKQCRTCNNKVIEDGRGASIALEVRSSDKRWRYDCMLVRGGVKIAALEIYHTHSTSQAKIQATRKNGLRIAEFRAEDVNSMQSGARLENLCPSTYLCPRCLLEASKSWILKCYREEQSELQDWDTLMYHAYLRDFNERKLQRLWMMTPFISAINHWSRLERTIEQAYWKLHASRPKTTPRDPKFYYYSVYHPPPYTNGIYAPYELIQSTRRPDSGV